MRYQSRPRRARVGELVQVDGSPHDWFEGRGPRRTRIVFIDDATNRLLALRFVAAETTEAYVETLRGHLAEHGRPVALYSDRYSVFRVNRKDGEDVPTQFTRALLTLDIEPIHAHTPQAKGRVERANLTLRNRLVKELRLRGAAATVCKGHDGSVAALLGGRRRTRRTAASGWTRPRRRRRRGRAGSRRRTILGGGRSRRPGGRRREPGGGFPNGLRVFHRLPTAAFEVRGGARPWKDRGKRYPACSGKPPRTVPPGGSEAGRRGHFYFALRCTKGDISTLR